MLYHNFLGWLVGLVLPFQLACDNRYEVVPSSQPATVSNVAMAQKPLGWGYFKPAWYNFSSPVCPSVNLHTDSEKWLRRPHWGRYNFTANKTTTTAPCTLSGFLCQGTASSLAPAAALVRIWPTGQTLIESPVTGASYLPSLAHARM